jgi:hypothetical protein
MGQLGRGGPTPPRYGPSSDDRYPSESAGRAPSAQAEGLVRLERGDGVAEPSLCGGGPTWMRSGTTPEISSRRRRWVNRSGWRASFDVPFPFLEVRFVAPDDAFLKPAFGRETCYLTAHMFEGMEWDPYFRAVEDILYGFGGARTGKRHFQSAATLRPATRPGMTSFRFPTGSIPSDDSQTTTSDGCWPNGDSA